MSAISREELAPGNGSDYEAACYRKLWLTVLLQVLGEAEGKKSQMLGLARRAKPRGIWRARKWLTTDSEDLRGVCEMAGLDKERLLKYTRRVYGRDVLSR